MNVLSEKMDRIEASGIREMFHMASDLDNPVNLSIGQPHFEVPETVKAEAQKAIQSGKNRYTQTRGISKLRQKLQSFIRERYDVETDNLLITAGASGALFLAFHVLLDPGDEILIPDPYFVMYKHLANAVHAEPNFLDTYPNFKIDPEELDASLTENTKLFIFNNPVNPTGTAYTREEVRKIAEVCKRNNVFVVTDEIYSEFTYDHPHASLYPFYPERTILVNGFSKTYGLPGWRVGWTTAPDEILDAMATLQQFSFVCANTPSQHACVKALETDMSEQINDYREKRDRLVDSLHSDFDARETGGAFYMFLRVPGDLNDQEFIERALDKELMVVPGSACSQKHSHFRISYAVPDSTLNQGIELLNELAGS